MTAAPRPNAYPAHYNSANGPRVSDHDKKWKLNPSAIPWQLPIISTPGMTLNALPTLLSTGTITRTGSDPLVAGFWDDSAAAAAKYTSDIADIISAGAADFVFMPAGAGEAAPDKFVMGFDATLGPPIGYNVSLSTAGIGGTMRMMYLAKDGTWKAFPYVVDLSVSLTAGTSTYNILHSIPSDWVPMIETEISSTVAYWYVAFEVVTVYSTNPAGTEITAITLDPGAIALGVQAPATGKITHVQYHGTAGGTAHDIILQIYNWTRRTRALVTLTGNPAAGRFALTFPLYVRRGDEVSISNIRGDGTTEIVGVTDFMLEIEI